MMSLEWRMTLASLVILPLFFYAARRLGSRLRLIARKQMEANAEMNAMANETLNIGGVLLVKLFGRIGLESDRFEDRASKVRNLGVDSGSDRNRFFCHHWAFKRSCNRAGVWHGRLPGHT